MMTMSGYLYQCSAGESFDSVAMNVYGNEKYACELMNANPEYASQIIFEGSEKLEIPVIDIGDLPAEEYATSSAPWKE